MLVRGISFLAVSPLRGGSYILMMCGGFDIVQDKAQILRMDTETTVTERTWTFFLILTQ